MELIFVPPVKISSNAVYFSIFDGMGQKNREWFNDENFWEQFAPVMFDDAHWQEVPQVADGIIRLACQNSINFENGRPKVLDLCCGFGRISAELGRRGLSVTGVDITKSYLRTAKEEAAYENLDIEYIHADVRNFQRLNFFDIVVNLYISFGYFENQNEDKILLRNIYKSLKPGGIFIIETLGKEIAARDFIEGDCFERAGFTIFTKYEILDSWTKLKNQWSLVKDGKQMRKIFSQRLYSASELQLLLLEAGFSEIQIYGDWDKSPYDHRAIKLIMTGKKAPAEK